MYGFAVVHLFGGVCGCSSCVCRFAYVEFGSEAAADKHYKLFQGVRLMDNEIVIDYVGKKSDYKAAVKETGTAGMIVACFF